MSVTRDFDRMLAEKAGERPTFQVAGQQFTLRAKLPYNRWNKLVKVMSDPEGDDAQAAEVFFSTVLIKADRERFLKLLRGSGDDEDDDADDDTAIDLTQVSQITDWAMAHFTGKAQPSSTSSSPGANGTGPQPSVVSLNARTVGI